MTSSKRPQDVFLQQRSRLARFFWPLSHYLVTNVTISLAFIFFRILNRTTVSGREHVPMQANTLLLSNHQTMIDSFLVGLCVFFPTSLYRPSVIPWNPAAEENFFRTPILAWLADNWKCIRIKKGRKDVGSIQKMAAALKTSPLTLFPEGTRTRDGSIKQARGGAGFLILETKPTVIPVCIDGMNEVLPIGGVLPRIFKRIHVRYGRPLDLSQFYGKAKNKEVAHAIMADVMNAIQVLQNEIHSGKGPKNRSRSGAPAGQKSGTMITSH